MINNVLEDETEALDLEGESRDLPMPPQPPMAPAPLLVPANI